LRFLALWLCPVFIFLALITCPTLIPTSSQH
jgi:hypothetical protein